MLETYKGLTLDRFQREALEGIALGQNVIVAAPTGAGKTLIAEYALESALQAGQRVIYTAPIKALSNQKFRDLSVGYPGQVGIATGDVSIDADAPALIMTTEIFRNTIFEDPARLEDVAWVIMDEVHYLDDPDRGTVWEESLIFAPPQIRVLALSATVSNLDEFADWIGEVRDHEVRVVVEERRPVPLTVRVASTEGGIKPIDQVRALRPARRPRRVERGERPKNPEQALLKAWKKIASRIADKGELPLLFFLFSRKLCEKLAEACADISNLHPGVRNPTGEDPRDEFQRMARAYDLDLHDSELRKLEYLVSRGIAYHHAGVLPALKEIVERLFTSGHIRLLCATETFALGVNMPARAVAFEGLKRFNGRARVPLRTREFQQMAGRAGRRGLDREGYVYLTYDPNRDDPEVALSIVKGRVEPVQSRFNLSYGTLINLYDRLGDKIYEACERSFANFKARRRHGGQGGGDHPLDDPERVRPGRADRHGGVVRRGQRDAEFEAWADSRQRRGRGQSARDEHRGGGRGGGGGRGRGRRGRGRGRRGRGGAPRRQPPQPVVKRGRAGFADIVHQVRLKLSLLSELEYLDSQGHVTDRGKFAMGVFGHELPVSELVWSGALDSLSAEQLSVVATAVVFESRKNTFYGGDDPRRILGKQIYKSAQGTIHRLVERELERGIREPSKLLDWELSGVTWAWVQGAEFSELRQLTDASDGDLVRTLRQTIQLLRLMVRPLRELGPRFKDLAGRVRQAQKLLKRGLVDAEWQLRRGAELEAEYEAAQAGELDEDGAAADPDEGPATLVGDLDEGPGTPDFDEAPEDDPGESLSDSGESFAAGLTSPGDDLSAS